MKRITWNLRKQNPYWHTFLHIGKQRIHCLWSSFMQIDLHGYAVTIAVGRYKVKFWKGWWKKDILSRIETSNRLLDGPTYMRLKDENPYNPSNSGTRLKDYADHPYFTDLRSRYNKSQSAESYRTRQRSRCDLSLNTQEYSRIKEEITNRMTQI